MQIAYHTLTGNTKRFASRLALESGLSAYSIDQLPEGEFLLVTHTFKVGRVPEATARFLERRGGDMRGVISSGSYQWGPNFARAADLIAEQWHVPMVRKINKSGTQRDVEAALEWLQKKGYA